MQGEELAIDAAIANLSRLAELFQLRREQLAREAGLTEAQWRVLEEISTEHFLPSLFARERRCTPAAVSKTLRQLLEKGLVRGEISERDGRQRVYRLTSEGRRRMERLRRGRRRAIRAIWRELPAADLARFTRLSGSLIERFEDFARREA